MIHEFNDQVTDMSLDDRRTGQRQVTICRVGIIHSSKTTDFCRIKNISAGGFMAHIYHVALVGDAIRIEMKSGQLLDGKVVWVRDDLVGIAFRNPIDIDATLSNRNMNADHLPRLPRIEVDQRVRLRCGSRYHSGRVCDISQSGAQVQISKLVDPETCVSVMLRDFPPISGLVRWSKGTRAGISFNETVRLEPLVRWIQDRRADSAGASLIEPAIWPRLEAQRHYQDNNNV